MRIIEPTRKLPAKAAANAIAAYNPIAGGEFKDTLVERANQARTVGQLLKRRLTAAAAKRHVAV